MELFFTYIVLYIILRVMRLTYIRGLIRFSNCAGLSQLGMKEITILVKFFLSFFLNENICPQEYASSKPIGINQNNEAKSKVNYFHSDELFHTCFI